MRRKREVIDAREAWRAAAQELDDAIGIEILSDPPPHNVDVLNIRRFRRALLAERETRIRYAAALKADRKPVPEDLLWDVPEDEQR